MTKPQKTVLLLFAFLLGVVLARVFWLSDEPSYDGKILSEWLKNYEAGDRDDVLSKKEADRAIRSIGTNAIPFLLEWIQYEEPGPIKSIFEVPGRPFRRMRYGRAECAMVAFTALGPKAIVAIPELTRVLNNAENFDGANRAARLLSELGEFGLPMLMAALTNQQAKCRCAVIYHIGRMGTNAYPAVPLLVQSLQDTNKYMAASAIPALGKLKMQPELVVPALTITLQHSNKLVRTRAAQALEEYGTNALFSIPALRSALNDPVSDVREAATHALQIIAPELLTNAPPK